MLKLQGTKAIAWSWKPWKAVKFLKNGNKEDTDSDYRWIKQDIPFSHICHFFFFLKSRATFATLESPNLNARGSKLANILHSFLKLNFSSVSGDLSCIPQSIIGFSECLRIPVQCHLSWFWECRSVAKTGTPYESNIACFFFFFNVLLPTM